MSTDASLGREGLFFVIGPLRTGSSLMARCLDDHPSMICLCESEINRALFSDYFVELHAMRMAAHGLGLNDTIRLLDRKKQDDVTGFVRWYAEAYSRLAALYDKPGTTLLGDKSPDFYTNPGLVQYLANNHPLIYTVRDPRAILASIEVQDDATPRDKAERWEMLGANYQAWRPYLDRPNILVVRYEDLITSPEASMETVYAHLGLPYVPRFLEAFPRLFPKRFLWTTSIDWSTGIRKDFDPRRIDSWKGNLTAERLRLVDTNEAIIEFMGRFGYDR